MGTVPEWFSMIGTIGAFATGGVLLWRKIRRNRAAEQDRVRDQASRVVVFLDEIRRADLMEMEYSPPAGANAQMAVVQNLVRPVRLAGR